MVAITVGFGAPRPTAVLAVLGYRIVSYWLPLIPGAVAYLRLRLRRGAAGSTNPRHRRPADRLPTTTSRSSARPSSYSAGQYHESRYRLYRHQILG